MGLDMYLNRRTFTKNFTSEGLKTLNVKVTDENDKVVIPSDDITEVIESVGYWRKANHIHHYFVENVQDGRDDCGEYTVGFDALIDLQDRCNKILADPELAETLLPTLSGFFFGDTSYGDDYFDDIRLTLDIINPLIEDFKNSNLLFQLTYVSSW